MRVCFELDTTAVVTAALVGFVGLFALHAAYPGLYGYWPSSSSDLASWVQAVGAIGSIVYAGRLLGRQLKHADLQNHEQWNREERQRAVAQMEADLAMLRSCCVVAEHTRQALGSVARKMSGDDKNSRDPRTGLERLESLQQVVNVLLGKAIPANAVTPLLQLAREIAYGLTALRTLSQDYVPNANDERAHTAFKRTMCAKDISHALELLKVASETDLHRAQAQ